jgi:hypothetical protein
VARTEARPMTAEIITSRALRSSGTSTHHLEAGARKGTFVRLRPGAYVTAAEWAVAAPVARHRLAIQALALTAVRPPVFARESAALLHGIPVLGGWPEKPHLIDSELGSASRRSPREAVVHRPRCRPGVCSIDGLVATTPVATAISLAASRDLVAGVAAIDYVLAQGAERDEFELTIREWQPFHGARRALRALDLATGLAETPLESVSLVGMLLAGLPRPVQQAEVIARGCRYRLDFWWPDLGVAGEADGRIKYLTGVDLLDEKRREDDIRSLDARFVRWGWDEAWAGEPMLERLRQTGVRPAPRFARYSAGFQRSNADPAE